MGPPNVILRSPMTRAHKIVNLIGVPAPLIGVIVAIVLLWDRAIGGLELGLLIGLYVITCLGVTLGYHRMFTHRAFESSRAFRAIIAVLGSMAVEGSVITWVADHRKHHAFTDQDGDPHSPHLSGPGFWSGVKGLWHAHVGWLFESVGTADKDRFAPDLVKDGVLRAIDKLFESWHHNHHAFPTSAFHGLRFWERLADPTGLVITVLEKLGIIWNVVRVSPERQRAKALSAGPA